MLNEAIHIGRHYGTVLDVEFDNVSYKSIVNYIRTNGCANIDWTGFLSGNDPYPGRNALRAYCGNKPKKLAYRRPKWTDDAVRQQLAYEQEKVTERAKSQSRDEWDVPQAPTEEMRWVYWQAEMNARNVFVTKEDFAIAMAMREQAV